jgi:hypothetical protein
VAVKKGAVTLPEALFEMVERRAPDRIVVLRVIHAARSSESWPG